MTRVVLACIVMVLAPAAVAGAEAPTASFLWFPAIPAAGEAVTFVSTATDQANPITGWAWEIAQDGTFVPGGPSIATTFAAPGAYAVRMQVSAGDGSTSVASETVKVEPATLTVLEPFPIVRFVAAPTKTGARLLLLSVEAPPEAEITVTCRGRACPARSASRVAHAEHIGNVTVIFGRFERALPAGTVLEVRVSKPGQVGAYTRIVIRRDRSPARTDECLSPAGEPLATCPA